MNLNIEGNFQICISVPLNRCKISSSTVIFHSNIAVLSNMDSMKDVRMIKNTFLWERNKLVGLRAEKNKYPSISWTSEEIDQHDWLNSLLEQLIQRHCLWVSNGNKTWIAFDFSERNVIFYFIFKKQNKLE